MTEERKKIQEDEIDLVELVKTIWAGRKFIRKVTSVFIVLGLIIAFMSPVEYEASSKLLPESQEGGAPDLGGLGSLAGLAGFDLGGVSVGSNSLSPQLYPEIVYSLPFVLDLMNDTLHFENKGLSTTAFNFFSEKEASSALSYILKYTIGMPKLIKSLLVSDNDVLVDTNEYGFERFSKKEWNLIQSFKERILVSLDEVTGIIYITCEMPDPVASAQLCKRVELMITDAVVNYKTNKAKTNLEFVNKNFNDAEEEFKSIQLKLALTADRNMNVTSSKGQIELERVENDYNVAFEVYKGLASQLEQAKIRLKEETPVFTILEPVRIPEDKSSPKRLIILIVFSFLGGVTGSIVCLFRNWRGSKVA